MIVKDLKISYLCAQCENVLMASSLGIEFDIDDIHKYTNMTQCPNCRGIGTMDATHIECVLGTEVVTTYNYTLRCNLCNARWVTNCTICGKIKFLQTKRRIEAEALCINPVCASRSFSVVAYRKIKDR